MGSPYFLGIIPARGGSKGIKNKNLHKINGKSLVALAMDSARGSTLLTDWLVSTDSEKIAEEVKSQGFTVPFMRPADLASDHASTADVVKHAIEFHENQNNCKVDYVVLLQPTSPFRQSKDIDESIELVIKNPDADSLITCHETRSPHPAIMYTASSGRMKPLLSEQEPQRRQDFTSVYVRNGLVYIVKRNLVVNEGKMRDDSPLAYIVPEVRGINIDEPIDLEIAEFMFSKLQLDENQV